MLNRWSAVVVAVPWWGSSRAASLWWRIADTTELRAGGRPGAGGRGSAGWTDWERRPHASWTPTCRPRRPATEVDGFLAEGFDADLTSTSALVASAPVLHERFGFSPASVDWELFSQSTEGAVVTLRLPESTDFDELADGLEELGYTASRRRGRRLGRRARTCWPEIGPDLTPELQHIALDRRRAVGAHLRHRGLLGTGLETARRPGRGRRPRWPRLRRAAVRRRLHRRRKPAWRWR